MTQSKRRLGLTVPLNLYEKLVAVAEYHGKTINSTCIDIFWAYFKSEHGKADSKSE